MIAMPTFWWTLGIAGFGGWMIVAVQQLEAKLNALFASGQSSPAVSMLKNLGGGNSTELNAASSSAMFVFLPLFLMAFAVTQVNRWSADEEDGRLELVLSAPQSRPRCSSAASPRSPPPRSSSAWS